MRFNNRAFSEAEQLTRLVAIDGNTSGFIKDTEGWRVLAASGVLASHTGDTTETALATIAIPAGAMGPNGMLKVTSLWTVPNSANNKTLRYRLGGGAGTEFLAYVATTSAAVHAQRVIQNRNSQASQVGFSPASSNSYVATTASNATGTINTANAQDLVISGQLASAGETITLEGYLVELKYGA